MRWNVNHPKLDDVVVKSTQVLKDEGGDGVPYI